VKQLRGRAGTNGRRALAALGALGLVVFHAPAASPAVSLASASSPRINQTPVATQATLAGTSGPIPPSGFIGFDAELNNGPAGGWEATDGDPTSPNFMQSVTSVFPEVLRWPGGTPSNYWNWSAGVPYAGWGWVLKGTTPVDRLEDLKFALTQLAAAGVEMTPIITVNMLTRGGKSEGTKALCLGDPADATSAAAACLKDQLAMLAHASAIGLPVKYVELGNELYKGTTPGNNDYATVFPTGTDYGHTALVWIKKIKAAFPGALVSVVGIDPGAAPGGTGRTGAWNRLLASALAPTQTATPSATSADGETFHSYPSNGLNKVPSSTCTSSNSTAQQCQDTFNLPEGPDASISQAFVANDDVNTRELVQRVPDTKIWLDEYQLGDSASVVRGTWTNGLFDVEQSLLYAADCLPRPVPDSTPCDLQMIAAHNLAYPYKTSLGFSKSFGDIFVNAEGTSGFANYPTVDYDGGSSANPTPTTPRFGLTAMGQAMALLLRGVQGATSEQLVQFSTNPNVGSGAWAFPALTAMTFSTATTTAAVIVNADPSSTYAADVTHLFASPNPVSFVTETGDPRLRIATSSDLATTTGMASGSVGLPPYSITLVTQ
jgi:hypothetical protein